MLGNETIIISNIIHLPNKTANLLYQSPALLKEKLKL